jgi:hypothetical protein
MRRKSQALSDTPISMYVVVWYDPMHLEYGPDGPELHVELCDSQQESERKAKGHQLLDRAAWPVRLDGEGMGNG